MKSGQIYNFQPIILYRKIQADHIFDGYRMLPSDRVLVLKKDGTVEDLIAVADAGDGVELFRGIISPGLINCHCHTELSHLKGTIPEKTGLIGFISSVMNNRSSASSEIIIDAAWNAIEEMRNNGIVAVGDICNNAHSIYAKKESVLHFHNFIEVSGFSASIAEKRLEYMQKILSEFEAAGMPHSLVPHAPYSVSTKLLRLIIGSNCGQPITMHNQEAMDENELYINGNGGFPEFYHQWAIATEGFEPSGKSSWQTFLPCFAAHNPTILVHNVHTSSDDIDVSLLHYREYPENLFLCLCPNANEYIGGQLPDINLLRKKGLQLVLGTDSLASNHQLNLLSEMRTLQAAYPLIGIEEMLTWATSNGAQALGINSNYGSFEKGKKPGVVLIEEMKVKQVII